ncbi:MAG TPA: hypothetical protein DDZ88_08240 [Verrucomicrobiales bacterium]|nr:hypothetical protein [Verrucomicrobiales bacterium]
MIAALPNKKIVFDERGNPLEVILAWSDYQDFAKRLGWDLDVEERGEAAQALADWKAGKKEEFVSLKGK